MILLYVIIIYLRLEFDLHNNTFFHLSTGAEQSVNI